MPLQRAQYCSNSKPSLLNFLFGCYNSLRSMNMILMKTKNEYLSDWWTPQVTSTPLKAIPDHLGAKKTQKQPVIQTDSSNFHGRLRSECNTPNVIRSKITENKVPVLKRTQKRRLSTYFDLSSSSDDDSSDNERPIIKLSSKKSTKVMIRNSKIQDDDQSIENTGTGIKSKKYENIQNNALNSTKENVFPMGNSRNTESKVRNNDSKGHIEPDFCCENTQVDSNKENLNLRKSKKKNLVMNVKLESNNIKDNIKDGENFQHLSGMKNAEDEPFLIKSDKRKILISKTVEKNQDIKKKTQDNKAPKIQNRKRSNNSTGSVKNSTRKAISRNYKSACKQAGNTKNVQEISQNKSNISHQLFSETTEQEYINILDLTTDEVNETPDSTRYLEKRKSCQSFFWPYQSSHKACINCKSKKEEEEEEKEGRKCELETQCQKSSPTTRSPLETKCEEIPRSTSHIDQTQKVSQEILVSEKLEDNLKKSCRKKNCAPKNQKSVNHRAVKKLKNKGKNNVINSNCAIINNEQEIVPVAVLNSSNLCKIMNISNESNKEDKNSCKCVKNGNTNSSENSVFQELGEMILNKNELGCSVVQCWSKRNFKCGVFKLKAKSQLTCKTLHSDSCMGGVLVKGSLKIKIGVKEQNLKEGDMAFVPPLTEWQATNNGKSESVFYYWSGRF